MRHRKSGNRLSRASDHRKALLRNLATSLVLHGKLQTTTAKAKAIKAHFEKVLSRVRRSDDINALRYLQSKMTTHAASKKFLEVARGLSGDSGWVCLTKAGFRAGDSAEVSFVELSEGKTSKAVHLQQ